MLYTREPVIRLTRPSDINTVSSMDLKCYHYPISMEEWKEKIEGTGKQDSARIIVVEIRRQPVGFAMWSIDNEMTGHLHRLGVLPALRRRNLGTLLMTSFVKHCNENHCEMVRCVVPSLQCQPGDPDDVSAFLNACGFKPNGEVLHDYRQMYGDLVDGYVFTRGTHDLTK